VCPQQRTVASADQPVVLSVGANPEPEVALIHLDGQRTMAQTDAHRPVTSDLLELQRRMTRITFQKFIIGIGKLANRRRQRLVGDPEFWYASQFTRLPGPVRGQGLIG
jgi:hypothetical protein